MTVAGAVADAHRSGWAQVLAATMRVARDVGLAEECVQDAYAAALTAWPAQGVPDNPHAWLITAARRRAIDAIRREQSLRTKLPLLAPPDEHFTQEPEEPGRDEEARLPDERLRLIFMCCHPAIAADVRPALTLRLVCGVPTADLARAFLVPEATMAARLTRAKKKITVARIPLRVPPAADLPARLGSVLGVIHLLGTGGHTAPSGEGLMRAALMDQALRLARMLRELMPDDPEVRGLLALLLVTDARRATRVAADGSLVRLQDQDRTRWDRTAIAEADTLIVDGLRGGGRPGRYVLQAAIAAVHAQAPSFAETDWPQVVALYDALLAAWPSPVVALNRAVAVSYARGPAVALADVENLARDQRLAGYHYLPAIRADLLTRLGRHDEAATARRQALQLTANEAERRHLMLPCYRGNS
jgi:RNA polymerase sigma factor (sigma-70 family)